MPGLRTEGDLRAALHDLSQDAPTAEAVLPGSLATSGYRARLPWLAAAAAVAVVLAISLSVAVVTHHHRAATTAVTHTPSAPVDTSNLIGITWQLRSVAGRSVTQTLSLRIDPAGRFGQSIGYCEGVGGTLRVSTSRLQIKTATQGGGLCPPPPHRTQYSQSIVTVLTAMFTGTVTWSITGDQLTLSKPDAPTLTYTRAATSPPQTTQWTFHGVGITVPSTWAKNATRCGTPTTNTVIFAQSAALSCAYRRPAGVTSVQFSTSPLPGVAAALPDQPGEQLLDNVDTIERHGVPKSGPYRGLTVFEIRVPSRHVVVTITSPNNDLAANLAYEALYITTR